VIAADHDFERLRDYIVGRLSDDERRAFEDRLVRDPALAGELEASLRIREGLRQLHGQGYFARAASDRRRFRLWQPALAAAAVAGLVLFLWGHRERHDLPVLTASLESRGGATVMPLVAARFTFVSMRGSSTPDLNLPPAGLIEILAAPVTRPTDSLYRLTLIRFHRGGIAATVNSLTDLSLGSDGYVHCFADASRLTEGTYLLRIEHEGTAADTVEFRFNLNALDHRSSQ
jgi:hypothetical protein